MSERITACHIDIRGVVQGVGFRPFVYRMASRNAIKGWVLNDSRGVAIHAEGPEANLAAFLAGLRQHPPAAAKIVSLQSTAIGVEGFGDFQILASEPALTPTAKISPDLPTCRDCLSEMHDPTSRRFKYPYINCTACGPRYSIIQSLPYDRPHTTMSTWALCDACQIEYDDPLNRRHHAQPTACNVCGPNYRLVCGDQDVHRGAEAVSQAAALLASGKIVAVKGIGGYHLACDASDAAVVERLRQRKFRKEKPFALMVRGLDEAHSIADLSELHILLLTSAARPIVLAKSTQPFSAVAPDTDELGLMLPYAPLHEMLFDDGAPSPLVLTSANRSSEPIAYCDEDALDRLGEIADAFLVGERPIARRVDDSVVAVRDGQTAMIRRARGYAPSVVARLPSRRPILALGADLKNAIALVVEGDVIVSQHIGDLGQLETNRAFEQTVYDFVKMYGLRVSDLIVVHDSHPEFVSTRFAASLECYRRIPVQHHRAHIASVMAEDGDLTEPVIGMALDGTGYGDDGTIWGFEVFVGSPADDLPRVAHLRSVPMPGGDAAARYPVQAAAGLLSSLDELPDMRQPPFAFPKRYDQARELVTKNVRCFASSSAGRLFDAVAALCGFTGEISFEGQAAMWLEHQAHSASPCEPYAFPELDPRPLLASIIADRLAGRDVAEISYAFHAALASSLLDVADGMAQQHSIKRLIMSGGVFQNRLLRSLLSVCRQRDSAGARFNRSVPTNDGGISLGQAAIASFHDE